MKIIEIQKSNTAPVIDIAVKCEIKHESLTINDDEIVEFKFFGKGDLPVDILHTHRVRGE